LQESLSYITDKAHYEDSGIYHDWCYERIGRVAIADLPAEYAGSCMLGGEQVITIPFVSGSEIDFPH
jgi:hypothetical protein